MIAVWQTGIGAASQSPLCLDGSLSSPTRHGEQLNLPCAWPRPPSLAALRQFTLKGGGFCRRQKTEGLLIAAFVAEAALQSPSAYRRSPLCTRGPWARVKYGANLAKNVHKQQTRQISSRCFSFAPAAGQVAAGQQCLHIASHRTQPYFFLAAGQQRFTQGGLPH